MYCTLETFRKRLMTFLLDQELVSYHLKLQVYEAYSSKLHTSTLSDLLFSCLLSPPQCTSHEMLSAACTAFPISF